jgi:hypothetical protein
MEVEDVFDLDPMRLPVIALGVGHLGVGRCQRAS